MGWSRKNDGARIYQEKKDKSFILVITEYDWAASNGMYSAIANVHEGADPSLASTGISPAYLRTRCKRVQWSDLPKIWQLEFKRWMQDWDQTPKEIRGFWKIAA